MAEAMAKGMRQRAGVSVAVSVTGIAGPGGATETKPVGLVYIGLDAGSDDRPTKEFQFHGDRSVIRQRAAQAALDLLRRWLIARGESMIRTFLAVEIGEDLRNQITLIQQDLKQRLDCESSKDVRITWVKPSSIHLTMKFLGDTAST